MEKTASGLVVPAHVAAEQRKAAQTPIVPAWAREAPEGHTAGLPRRNWVAMSFPKGTAALPMASKDFRYQTTWLHAMAEERQREGGSIVIHQTFCGRPAVKVEPDEWSDRYGNEGVAWCGFCKTFMALLLGDPCCYIGESARVGYHMGVAARIAAREERSAEAARIMESKKLDVVGGKLVRRHPELVGQIEAERKAEAGRQR